MLHLGQVEYPDKDEGMCEGLPGIESFGRPAFAKSTA